MTYSKKMTGLAISLTFILGGVAQAQDNPLLAPPSDNPLLQENTSVDASFQSKAAAIDAAATREASDPVCQNISANYQQSLEEILEKSDGDGFSLSQINQFTSRGNSATWRLNRMNRNLGGSSSGALGEVSQRLNQGTALANDAAALGSLFGISGKKMSEKKAKKKAAKLDEQALDAVEQTGCPMATFS